MIFVKPKAGSPNFRRDYGPSPATSASLCYAGRVGNPSSRLKTFTDQIVNGFLVAPT
jgi:hypothetical protein